jgi:hypothetical protein
MAEQEKDRNLDHLLDSLLAGYSDALPRPGLETRVMAQLREQAGRKRYWQWNVTWMWAGATAALLVLAFAFMLRREPAITPPQPPAIRADWSLLHNPGPWVVQPFRIETAAHKRKTGTDPEHIAVATAATVKDTRPDVFPTPAPLSDQEKLLLRYLARTARREVVAQSHPDEPVETAEPFLLQIQPPTKTEFNNSTR